MIGFYNYTVLFTLFGTMSGLVGIMAACKGDIFIALICLMISGFFDMFDGTIARTKKNRSEFEKKYGVQLDSLSDVVCFGVLPTVIALQLTSSLGYVSAFCILYFVASISRLAYFNVEEEMRSKKEKGARTSYTGLPVTTSSMIVPVLYCMNFFTGSLFPILFLIGMLIFAGFQVSKIKLPHLNLRELFVCLVIGILILMFLLFKLF